MQPADVVEKKGEGKDALLTSVHTPQSQLSSDLEKTEGANNIEAVPSHSGHNSRSTLLKRFDDSNSTTTTIKVDAYDGNSPYAEVRACVPNYDDESMLQNTVRMWVIGVTLMSAAAVMNAVFFIHDPPFVVSPFLLIVLAWPLGLIWEKTMPNKWGLNPGPFTYKEHVLIAIFAASSSMNHTSEAAISLTFFHKHDRLGSNLAFVILVNWGAALVGMSIAGPLRRILVDPPSMVWPNELITVTLLSNLHIKWNHVANGWRITRKKFFFIVAVSCSVYSFIVHFLMRFLGKFSFASWITPQNYVVNQMFGIISGAGIFPITFDWNEISGVLPSPLVPPGRVFTNAGISLVSFVWIIATAVHYSNVWWGTHLPFSDARVFDRFGDTYRVFDVVKDRLRLDVDQYRKYSPVFLTTTCLFSFGMNLASSISILVHTCLFDSTRILSYFRKQPDDVHSLLMRKYKPIPNWWYLIVFVGAVCVIYGSAAGFDTGVSLWYPVVAICMIFIWVLPAGFLCAATTVTVSINALVLLMTGYMDPGNSLGMMLFKNWTVGAIKAGIDYLSILKFGHYTKVSPRLVFVVRFFGVLWSGALQMIALVKVKPHVPKECQLNQDSAFKCVQAHSYFTESIVWGIVGSKRVMALYKPLLHFLWIGAVLPVILWLWLKKWPRSKLRVIHCPLFFDTISQIPPATPYNYSCWILIGITFSRWIRRYWHSWWAKYCYTLSAALDVGVATMQLLIFFIYVGSNYLGPVWWGNNGFRNTIDGRSEPMVPMKDGESFGPSTW